jgi:hypothetical protein
MKLKVPASKGGGDPKEEPKSKAKAAPSSSLTFEQRDSWSNFVESNPGKTFDELWIGFQASNPNSGIDKNTLQKELDVLRQNTIRIGTKTGSDLGSSLTTGYAFPKMTVDGKAAGRVDPNLQSQSGPPPPQPYPESLLSRSIPKDATDILFDEKTQMVTYIDPRTGDVKYAKRDALSSPQQRKLNLMRAQVDVPQRESLLAAQSSSAPVASR